MQRGVAPRHLLVVIHLLESSRIVLDLSRHTLCHEVLVNLPTESVSGATLFRQGLALLPKDAPLPQLRYDLSMLESFSDRTPNVKLVIIDSKAYS